MNRIKEIRQEKNLSQTDIAKALGVTRQAISLYEKGDREPKLETWQKLADFFDVSVPYLQGISDIKDLKRVSTFTNFLTSLEQTEESDEQISNEIKNLTMSLRVKTFLRISHAILSEQNGALPALVDVDRYKKLVSNFDNTNLKDISDINANITDLYLIMLNAMQGKKKDKEAYNKIQKIINEWLTIDENDELYKSKKDDELPF